MQKKTKDELINENPELAALLRKERINSTVEVSRLVFTGAAFSNGGGLLSIMAFLASAYSNADRFKMTFDFFLWPGGLFFIGLFVGYINLILMVSIEIETIAVLEKIIYGVAISTETKRTKISPDSSEFVTGIILFFCSTGAFLGGLLLTVRSLARLAGVHLLLL